MTTDLTAPEGFPPLEHYRTGLEKALRYGRDACTFDTIAERVQNGAAQFWPVSDRSVIVTQIDGTTLHFWLAAGDISELEAATPHILDEGRAKGCTKATLVGRPGWVRSFLSREGWTQSPLVMLEREL